ncbi:hypothetical protein TALC_00289 [Thermoplasmatales archaeon BRNA1]|nr:hypothetical protein TALC_00289 [Thermoplasmatales archaeon BRNA1]
MPAPKTVVIACVTFETAKVVEPATSYKADEIHLFHYLRPDAPGIYLEFYAEVEKQLRTNLPNARIIEHKEDAVYSFQLMLRDILAIVAQSNKEVPGAEILINASAGTSEFSAAAIIASMMHPNVTAFTVGTKEYTVTDDSKVRDIYFSGGRPVGLTKTTREPRAIPYFEVKMPDENLVRGLRVYNQLRTSKQSTVAPAVIKALADAGLWEYEANEGSVKTSPKQKEVMYYQRHFINAWVEQGWIDKPSRRSRFDLTETGKNVIDTFYID